MSPSTTFRSHWHAPTVTRRACHYSIATDCSKMINPLSSAQLGKNMGKRMKFTGTKNYVQLCLTAADLPGEVEVLLGEDYPVNPAIKGALKSLGGVIAVEEV